MKLEVSKTEITKMGDAEHMSDNVKLDMTGEKVICTEEMK